MRFYNITSASVSKFTGAYDLKVMADFGEGKQEYDFLLSPTDDFGISPQVRAAMSIWISQGKPVAPLPVPTPEQLRAQLPPLTRRQLLRTLLEIGITEDTILADLEDPADVIDFKAASEFQRLHPLMVLMAGKFELPPEQVDALWQYGLSI